MPGQQRKSGDERVARLIRERREALGITRRELADRTGLSYPYISQLETAYRLPSSKNVHVLARCLGVPPSELFQALPGDPGQGWAADVQAAASPAPAPRWLANPNYQQPAEPGPVATPEDAALSAVRALELLPPDSRLEALATVQAAVLAGIVRDQAAGPSRA